MTSGPDKPAPGSTSALVEVFPESGVTPDLANAYAWPDQGTWVRAMMVMSLDGAITGADGRSGSISSATDRAIMKLVRRFSDAVLIGASTMRAERYSPMRANADDVDARRSLGLDDAPVIAIVSGTLDLPWDLPAFSDSHRRPIVLTSTSCDEEAPDIAEQHCELVRVPGLAEDPGAIIDALEERGLHRIICEGGARLLGDLTRADRLDEFDVAISPTFANDGQALLHARFDMPKRLALAHVYEDEGFLFTRYLRADPAHAS